MIDQGKTENGQPQEPPMTGGLLTAERNRMFWLDLAELAARLNRGMYDGVAFSLECRNAFEPHGRASETWEDDWRLTIPDIPQHWRNSKGEWTPCVSAYRAAHFHGRTPDVPLRLALQFLRESGIRPDLKARASQSTTVPPTDPPDPRRR